MTVYYYDTAASGDDDGSSWANAWQTLAKVMAGTDAGAPDAPPAAGDIVYCRGSEIITTTVAVTGANKGTPANYTRFIGVNSSGDNNGDRCVIDGNNNAVTGLELNDADYVLFENWEIKNCDGGGGVDNNASLTSQGVIFKGCYIHDNEAGCGETGPARMAAWHWWNCIVNDNTTWGINTYTYASIINCVVTGNGTIGVRLSAGCLIYGCLVASNNGVNISATGGDSFVINSVIDNSITDDNIDCSKGLTIIGCRITGADTGGKWGVDPTEMIGILATYFQNNGGSIDGTENVKWQDIRENVLTSVTESGGDANEGYENAPTNYNLQDDPEATYYDLEITLPTV